MRKSEDFLEIEKAYKKAFGSLPKYEYNGQFTEEFIGEYLWEAVLDNKPIDEDSTKWLGAVYYSVNEEGFPGWFPVPETEHNRKILKKCIAEKLVYAPPESNGKGVLY